MTHEESGLWPPTDSLSKEEIRELIRRFEDLGADFKDMLASLNPLTERRLRELAGPHLEVMRETPQETVKYLTDPDPKLREAALQLAYEHWSISDRLASVYENMALSDPSHDVRNTAISALGTCYSRTKNPRIGHLLAAIVLDDSLPDSLRLTGFASLLRLHRLLDYTGTSPLVAASLQEIDWAFVDRYYRGWKGGEGHEQGNQKS
jgi:hypothetical protein